MDVVTILEDWVNSIPFNPDIYTIGHFTVEPIKQQ